MNSSVITDVRNVIGANGSDDWLLTPEVHSATLPSEAGALRRVLLRDNLKAIMAKFKIADASAGAAQKKYRFWGRLGIYSIAAAAVIGTALILRVQPEYFRRYQLDVQRSYYKGRGGQHERTSGHSALWSFVSTGPTVLWALIAGEAFIHLAAQQGWMSLPSWLELLQLENFERWIMALGVVASSLYGASAARSLMDLDARNAARYITTSDNLEYIAGTLLDDTRQTASAGDAA